MIHGVSSHTTIYPKGVLAGYNVLDGGPMELHIANPKKYMSLKFYTQKNTWYQNFLPKK